MPVTREHNLPLDQHNGSNACLAPCTARDMLDHSSTFREPFAMYSLLLLLAFFHSAHELLCLLCVLRTGGFSATPYGTVRGGRLVIGSGAPDFQR